MSPEPEHKKDQATVKGLISGAGFGQKLQPRLYIAAGWCNPADETKPKFKKEEKGALSADGRLLTEPCLQPPFTE